ncbi:hypothetical protein ACFYUR_18680 [Micromonospora haikouensis]|uniref:hypothetical protein n=1 Tax=Micromonospora haikouensis TaxID=686309 RepID=UPI003686FA9B
MTGMRVWRELRRSLGITRLRKELHEQEKRIMAKFSDEMNDLRNRLNGLAEAQAASSTNLRDAIGRLETRVQELQDGELSEEQQAIVDGMKADVDALRDAAASADDGYEPPIVEPAPVPGVEGEPAPGSVEDRERGGI